MTTEKFEQWAIVELFGHTKLAGQVSEQTLGGNSFVRVDVPETSEGQAFTKLYGAGAVYCITPVCEETARAAAEQIQARPVIPWQTQRALERARCVPALPEEADDELY